MSPTDDDLLRAVEKFAQAMTLAGIPVMPARVFAYVLAEDSDRYTAAELAKGLRVSPAAISGALRYLLDGRLLFREREPGVRSVLYRVYDDDVWYAIMSARIPLMGHFERGISEAIELIGPDTRGGRRLVESREFFHFVQQELTGMMERWSRHRAERFG